MNKILKLFLPIIIAVLIPHTVIGKDNDTWISETAKQACIEYGEKYGVSVELIEAIIETESWGVPSAENGNCKGLMQINLPFHQDRMKRLGITNIFDERQNILVGADLLAELLATYGDVAVALGKYHGEYDVEGRTQRGELSYYVLKIMARSAELEKIHRE